MITRTRFLFLFVILTSIFFSSTERKERGRIVIQNFELLNDDSQNLWIFYQDKKLLYDNEDRLVLRIMMNSRDTTLYAYKDDKLTFEVNLDSDGNDTTHYTYEETSSDTLIQIVKSGNYEVQRIKQLYDKKNRLVFSKWGKGYGYKNLTISYEKDKTIKTWNGMTVGAFYEQHLNKFGDETYLIHEVEVDKDGDGEMDTEENGRPILGMGKPITKSYSYLLDHHGNWIEKEMSIDSVKIGRWTRKITYL